MKRSTAPAAKLEGLCYGPAGKARRQGAGGQRTEPTRGKTAELSPDSGGENLGRLWQNGQGARGRPSPTTERSGVGCVRTVRSSPRPADATPAGRSSLCQTTASQTTASLPNNRLSAKQPPLCQTTASLPNNRRAVARPCTRKTDCRCCCCCCCAKRRRVDGRARGTGAAQPISRPISQQISMALHSRCGEPSMPVGVMLLSPACVTVCCLRDVLTYSCSPYG